MGQVAKNKENLKKCLCIKCPSYTLGCKIKAMPKNVVDVVTGIEKKEDFEGMFCAFKKSKCLKDGKPCICAACSVYKNNNLEKLYYCLENDGK